MVLVALVSAAAAVVAVARWVLVRRQLRSVADQLRRRREAGVHAPVHLQLVDGAVEALVVQINATIAQAERTGARLRRHERRYRELVADLSHDLRTPLTAVRGYQQMLAASALDPTWPDQLTADAPGGALVVVEGLTMYLVEEELRGLMEIIAAGLPGATVLIEFMPRLFQRYGREHSVKGTGARFTYGCSDADEFRRAVAPEYALLHDVPFTRTIARYHPLLSPLMRLPLVGRLSERIVVLRAPA